MKKGLKFLLGAVQNGIPLISTAKKLFIKKKLPANLDTLPANDLIAMVKDEYKEDNDKLYNLLKLVAEAVVVWGFVYAIKHFGFSIEDIVTIGGLINF